MSETLRDLVVSLSLNSDNFTRNIKSINKQIQEAESAFRLASAGVENFETTTAGLSSKLSTLQRTFQLQQDAVGQYERALQQASDKLQECYTRQNDYAQRLADAKDKQQQLKAEVASAAQDISTIRIRSAKRILRRLLQRQIWTLIRANIALPFRKSKSWKARTSR